MFKKKIRNPINTEISIVRPNYRVYCKVLRGKDFMAFEVHMMRNYGLMGRPTRGIRICIKRK